MDSILGRHPHRFRILQGPLPVVAARALAVSLAVILATASGCAIRQRPPAIPMVWPEPPDPPRIEFVTAVASERNLGRRFDVGRSLTSGLLGVDKPVWHLYQPVAVAPAADGTRVYVADYSQALLYIFDFDRGEVRTIGEDGGFSRPIGVAVDGAGQVYVSDQRAKVVQVLSPDGTPVRTLRLANIERPGGIAIDRSRRLLYVTDSPGPDSKDHYVRVYDLDGRFLRNLGNGRGDGPGELYFPTYVAVGPSGDVYVSDTMNSRVAVFDAEGKFLRQVGERGDTFGQFDKPKGVALDSFGNLYVVDSSWSVVQIFNASGDILLFFGGRSRYPGMLENPTGIAIDDHNKIYVCDTFNHRLSVYRLVNTTAADSLVAAPSAAATTNTPGS